MAGAFNNDGSGNNAGHVRIYEWNGLLWPQMVLDIDGEGQSDGSGGSVSMNSIGDRVAIGASRNGRNSSASGHTRIYEWSGSNWVQLGVDIDGEASINFSGIAVSMNSIGDKLAIGAHRNNGNGSYSCHLRVFENYLSTNLAIAEKIYAY